MNVRPAGLNAFDHHFRHVVTLTGNDNAIELALRHISENPGGHWADERTMADASRYIDGRPVVLEFEPSFYVTAGFAMVDFAITARRSTATVSIGSVDPQGELIRLFAAFHHAVDVNAIIVDQHDMAAPALTRHFTGGLPQEDDWMPTAEFDRAALAIAGGLDDPWRKSDDFLGYVCEDDIGYRLLDGPLGHLRVRGQACAVAEFRLRLLMGERAHTACYVEDVASNDVIVRLRDVPDERAVAFLARLWSRAHRDLEVDTVVTRPSGIRRHERFVNGNAIMEGTVTLSRRQREDAFMHRLPVEEPV